MWLREARHATQRKTLVGNEGEYIYLPLVPPLFFCARYCRARNGGRETAALCPLLCASMSTRREPAAKIRGESDSCFTPLFRL